MKAKTPANNQERTLASGEKCPAAGFIKVVLHLPEKTPAGTTAHICVTVKDGTGNEYTNAWQTLTQDAWSESHGGAFATIYIPAGKGYYHENYTVGTVEQKITYIPLPW